MSLIPPVNEYLKNLGFPASKQEILDEAILNNATEEVIERLSRIPNGKYYGMSDLLRNMVSRYQE